MEEDNTTFDLYLVNKGRSANTVTAYVTDIRQFSKWYAQTNGEDPTPATITTADIRDYKQFLMVTEKAAPATINRRLAAIKVWSEWAISISLIDRNPMRVRGVNEQQLAPKWLDRRQQAALLRAIEKNLLAAHTANTKFLRLRDQSVVVVLLNTGLRIGELCSLEMSDITISERKGMILVRSGKGQKARKVPINQLARDAIREWLKIRPAGDLLFDVTPRSVQRTLSEISQSSGLDVTPHILRHSFAKNLIDSGVSLDQVATLLGHSSLDTTRIYTTPSHADLEKAVNALDN